MISSQMAGPDPVRIGIGYVIFISFINIIAKVTFISLWIKQTCLGASGIRFQCRGQYCDLFACLLSY